MIVFRKRSRKCEIFPKLWKSSLCSDNLLLGGFPILKSGSYKVVSACSRPLFSGVNCLYKGFNIISSSPVLELPALKTVFALGRKHVEYHQKHESTIVAIKLVAS